MKTIIKSLVMAASAVCLAVSCTDLSEVNERLDNLENRISAVEAVLPALNSNVEALQKLAGGGTINSVEEQNGVYRITLSNGDKITLNQGSIGIGKAPVMSISADGYWMADYQDGNGPAYVLSGGQKVSAFGKDGATPLFGVDNAGYWTVSYDAGTTYERVKDSAGNPVKAIDDESASDSYFADVRLADSILYLTLKSGQTYKVPVLADFLFSIKGAEDIQLFSVGESRSYEIEKAGVADAIISRPAGWEVSISDQLLTIHAPATLPTKAILADSAGEISVLAISESGYSTIAKVRIQLAGAVVEANPRASVTNEELNWNSASFKVITEEVTSWYYIFRKTTEGVPDAASLQSSGTVGTTQNLSFENLESKTSYSLYVLPVNDTKLGTIVSVSVTTPAEPVVLYTDNLAAWNEGKTINIAGEKYSKATHGEATVLTAESIDTEITGLSSGVYILDCAAGCNFLLPHTDAGYSTSGDIVLIGRYAASKPLVKLEGFFTFRGSVAIRDLNIDYSVSTKAYKFTLGATIDRFHVDGCTLVAYNGNQTAYCANYVMRSLRIVNNDIRYDIAQNANAIGISFSSSKKLYDLKEVTVENNIVYNPVYAFYLMIGCNTSASIATQEGTPGGVAVSLCNNTFYNMTSSSGQGGLIFLAEADLLTIDKNIFWTACTSGTHRCLRLLTASLPAASEFGSNIAYGFGYGSAWRYFHDSTDYLLTRLTESPMASVVASTFSFIPTEEYTSYGAQRN